MAVKGLCSNSFERHGNILAVKFNLTADGAGDCSQNDIGNTGTGVGWYANGIYGTLIGARIINHPTNPSDANYDIYVYDHEGIDILAGKGVNMALADVIGNLMCGKAITNITNFGEAIYLWNTTLEVKGDEMAAANQCSVEIYIRLDAHANDR